MNVPPFTVAFLLFALFAPVIGFVFARRANPVKFANAAPPRIHALFGMGKPIMAAGRSPRGAGARKAVAIEAGIT